MICINSFILWHMVLYTVIVCHKIFYTNPQNYYQAVKFSDHTCIVPEEHEGTLLHGCGSVELRLSESTVVPELEPVEVPWAVLDVIFIPMVLEEKHLVTPE